MFTISYIHCIIFSFIYKWCALTKVFFSCKCPLCTLGVVVLPPACGGQQSAEPLLLTGRSSDTCEQLQTTWRCPSVLLVSVAWQDGLCPLSQRDTGGLLACQPGRASSPHRPGTVSFKKAEHNVSF